MELPHMGQHCQENSCKQLDYLPMKCDACSSLFCKDHLTYDDHACSGKYKKDIQVPVCPLCSAPVPVARGAVPDLAVSAHIDQGCPAKKKPKVFKNRCHRIQHGKQCKTHELVPCVCTACNTNFCLAHRHPADHDCQGSPTTPATTKMPPSQSSRPTESRQSRMTDFFTGPFRTGGGNQPSPAALAAMQRQQQSSTARTAAAATSRGSRPASTGRPISTGRPTLTTAATPRNINGMSEDEALAAAMAASLQQSEAGEARNGGQEEDDLALARALHESEIMARNQGQRVGQGDKNCSMQ